MQDIIKKLLDLDVNARTEKKNGLTYLSWAWAWQEVLKICPDATYKIKKNEQGLPYFFDENTGYMVFTEVTIGGLTHEMWLPVMDHANKAMKSEEYTYQVKEYEWVNGKKVFKGYIDKTVEPATMFDVNKAIMRCLVKNLAMFGLGLYIYAGEDLPEASVEFNKIANKKIAKGKISPLEELIVNAGHNIPFVCESMKVKSLADLTNLQYSQLINRLQKEK